MTESHRERLLKVIDDTPAELKTEFGGWMNDIPEEELRGIFGNHPVFGKVSVDVVRTFAVEMMRIFWDELSGDLNAFCDYWKNQVPSDTELNAMSEPELEAFEDSFEADTERIFGVWMERFHAQMNPDEEAEGQGYAFFMDEECLRSLMAFLKTAFEIAPSVTVADVMGVLGHPKEPEHDLLGWTDIEELSFIVQFPAPKQL